MWSVYEPLNQYDLAYVIVEVWGPHHEVESARSLVQKAELNASPFERTHHRGKRTFDHRPALHPNRSQRSLPPHLDRVPVELRQRLRGACQHQWHRFACHRADDDADWAFLQHASHMRRAPSRHHHHGQQKEAQDVQGVAQCSPPRGRGIYCAVARLRGPRCAFMVLLPQKAGPLTLMRKLGGDGIVESYTAILDEPAGKAVIAHKFTQFLIKDGGRMAVVESRIRDLLALRHPVLVSLIDHIVVGEDHYAVCEQIDGVDLATVLQHCRNTDTPVPRNVYLNLATQICNGLEALHSRPGTETGSSSVLHMGLKPSSIRLTPDGKVLLGEFGWLRSPTTVPHTGLDGTTPRMEYLAPEQTHPDQKLTPASDIFSLGAILYEMLTLRPMFLAESTLQTIHRVRRAEVTTQLLEVKELLPGLDRVLYRALSLNPRHRYQRAFVLREDLRGLMAGFSFARIIDDTRAFLAPLLGGATQESVHASLDRPLPEGGAIGAAATPLPLPTRAMSLPPPMRGEPTFIVPDFEAEEITALKRGVTLEPAEGRSERPGETLWFTREAHETPTPSPSLAGLSREEPEYVAATPIPVSDSVIPIGIIARTLPPEPPEVTEPTVEPANSVTWNPSPVRAVPGPERAVPGPEMASPEIWLDRVDPLEAEEAPPDVLALPVDAEPPVRKKKKKKRTEGEVEPLSVSGYEEDTRTEVRKATPITRPPRLDTRTATPLPSRSADFEDAWERQRPRTPVGVYVAAGLLAVAFACAGLTMGGSVLGFFASSTTSGSAAGSNLAAATPVAAPTTPPPAPAAVALAPIPAPVAAVVTPRVAEPAPIPVAPVPVAPKPVPVAAAPKPVPVAPKPPPFVPKPAPVVAKPAPVVAKPAPVAPKPVVAAPKPSPAAPQPARVAPSVAGTGRTKVVEEPVPPPSPSVIDLIPDAGTRAQRGGLTTQDRTALEAIGTSSDEYSRANALLYQDAKARGASTAREAYLNKLLAQPENQYKPEYLVEQAEIDLRARRWGPALETARTAERYWARMPPDLIFSKKALIYEIEAAANTGIFFDSEGKAKDTLAAAIRGWERYREHVATRERADLLARADEHLADLRAIEARLP